MSFAPDTILVIHRPSLNPYPFVSRLVGRDINDEELVVPWTIDNKYYTAQVNIQLLELDDDGVIPTGVEVLIYLFDEIPRRLPYALAQTMVNDPKDIALAVKTSFSPLTSNNGNDKANEDASGGKRISAEDMEDMFDELGLELVDETAQPEDDDERPILPLETIRQTLMTHMWRGMVRKPSGIRGSAFSGSVVTDDLYHDGSDDGEDDDYGYDGERKADGEGSSSGPSTFPISFNTTTAATRKLDEGSLPGDAFPGLAELKAQIEMDDLDRFERTGRFGVGGMDGAVDMDRMDRLGILDELLGAEPGEDEYARLEEWLDDDGDDQGDYGFAPLGEDDVVEERNDLSAGDHPTETGKREETDVRESMKDDLDGGGAQDGDKTFDDDFDDFAAFQSAPTRPQRDTEATMDPAPLLYHLQNVRAELAGMGEEERRERAGKEVARVMRDLGFDAGDIGDLLGEENDF